MSGVGGFVKHSIPASVAEKKAMVFTFGGNGFFGYSSSAPVEAESLMWWSNFETSTLPSTNIIEPSEIKAALLKRHQHWEDPVIQSIIQNAEVTSIYPTWTLGELPYWGENGIVLVGDAAHALDPTTGQGASQALEDSQTLVLLLAQSLKRTEKYPSQTQEGIETVLKLYYEIRNPRIQKIVERGKKMANKKANVNIVAEYTMYFFLWLMMKFPAIGKCCSQNWEILNNF
jgi:2-polyprenyl-6-methoxyphenol hydroxylase-like FAD-dependent oxidoreductase